MPTTLLWPMSRPEAKIEEMLVDALIAKFGEIADHIAGELGLGDPALLSERDRSRVDDETVQAIEDWTEAEVAGIALLRTATKFQRLLSEYRDLEDATINERDARLSDKDGDV